RRAAAADQPAPGATADQRTQTSFLEIERERVAPRAAPPVDQHHLRPRVRYRRRLLNHAIARLPVAPDRTVEQLDEPVGDLAAAVEPLVDHHAILVGLGSV